jgi:hypothetical protein
MGLNLRMTRYHREAGEQFDRQRWKILVYSTAVAGMLVILGILVWPARAREQVV